MYHTQMQRHGLTFEAGDFSMCDFICTLKRLLPKTSEIFVVQPQIKTWLMNQDYPKEHISVLPQQTCWNTLNTCPQHRCEKHLEMLAYTCSKQICYEIYNYIRPAFIPYFDFDLHMSKKRISNVEYSGLARLTPPEYTCIAPIDLLAAAFPKTLHKSADSEDAESLLD